MSLPPPNRRLEKELGLSWGTVVGMDEVGRGALAGPVCVGAVAVKERMGPEPEGLTDSKNLGPRRRQQLVAPINQWATENAVGWASASEIDSLGIIIALRLAGWRAVRTINAALQAAAQPLVGGILLDGSHNWFSTPTSLFDDDEWADDPLNMLPVVTETKADLSCVAVSAASILAKVARDTYMEQLEDDRYDWSSNKGYGSAKHRQALIQLGASIQHRRTWNLLGTR